MWISQDDLFLVYRKELAEGTDQRQKKQWQPRRPHLLVLCVETKLNAIDVCDKKEKLEEIQNEKRIF
jgi:hypothetical protein